MTKGSRHNALSIQDYMVEAGALTFSLDSEPSGIHSDLILCMLTKKMRKGKEKEWIIIPLTHPPTK